MKVLFIVVLLLVVGACFALASDRKYAKKADNPIFKQVNSAHLKTMGRHPQTDLWFYNCSIDVPTLEGDYVRAFNEGHWRRRSFVEKTSDFRDTRAYYRSSSKELAFEQVATLVTGEMKQETWTVMWTTSHLAESRLMNYLSIESRAYGSDLLFTAYLGEESRRTIVTEQLQVRVPQEHLFLSTTFIDDPIGVFLPIRSWCDCRVVAEEDQPTVVRAAFLAFEAQHVPFVWDPVNPDDLAYVYQFPGSHDELHVDDYYVAPVEGALHWADYFGH